MREIIRNAAMALVLTIPQSNGSELNLATNSSIPQYTHEEAQQFQSEIKKLDAYNDFINMTFYKDHNLMKEDARDNSTSYAWTLSRVIDASYIMNLLHPQNQSYKADYENKLRSVETYWSNNPSDQKPGFNPSVDEPIIPTRFVDDNLWFGLEFIRDFENSADTNSLNKAKAVFDLAKSQWDQKEGGTYWQEQFFLTFDRQKGIVSNAPTVMLSVGIYEQTGDKSYLEFAKKTMNWINSLEDPADGLFWDHIENEEINKTKWSYNQGTVVGALTKLNEVLPKEYALSKPIDLASNALNFFEKTAYQNQPVEFNAIFFQNLLYLASKVKNPVFTEKILYGIKLAIESAPKNSSKLIEHAGVLDLQALLLLDQDKYQLLY